MSITREVYVFYKKGKTWNFSKIYDSDFGMFSFFTFEEAENSEEKFFVFMEDSKVVGFANSLSDAVRGKILNFNEFFEKLEESEATVL